MHIASHFKLFEQMIHHIKCEPFDMCGIFFIYRGLAYDC